MNHNVSSDFLAWLWYLFIAYAVISNIVAVLLTIHDKNAARKHQWRVPENTLMMTAALSGCVAMYITMLAVHHKTKHKKFMIGIPVIFVLEAAAAVLFFYIVCSDSTNLLL